VAKDPHKKAKIIVNTTLAAYVVDDANGRNFYPVGIERFRYETLQRAAKHEPDFKVIENSKFTTDLMNKGCAHWFESSEMASCFANRSTFFNTTPGSYGLFVAVPEMGQWTPN
jgi:hypothetical protein